MSKSFKDKLDLNDLPQHIAIIMDGNGRWAQAQGKDRSYGHRQAIHAVRAAINACNEIGVPYLTLYTFSSENWNRPVEEVSALMDLLYETIFSEREDIMEKKLRMHVIGDMDRLPDMVKEQLQILINSTKDHKGGNLILALSYGSQREITKAVQAIARKVENKELSIEDINENCIENHLYTRGFPMVDLMIRTSGEVRISNFLLWQLAYAEMQFLEIMWPDFDRETLFQCIYNYQTKERRFGLTSAQVSCDNIPNNT